MDVVKKAKSGHCEFTLEMYYGIHFSALFPTEMDFLCNDGYVKSLPSTDFTDAFVLYSRDEVVRLQEAIISSIKEKCREAGLDDESVGISFLPHLKRTGNPNHFFTLDEKRVLMRNANDDENNKLVIDENGNACLVQNPSLGLLYPVSIETWGLAIIMLGLPLRWKTHFRLIIFVLSYGLNISKRGVGSMAIITKM